MSDKIQTYTLLVPLRPVKVFLSTVDSPISATSKPSKLCTVPFTSPSVLTRGPAPVAVNSVLGLLSAAPIVVKSVFPVVNILYFTPAINEPEDNVLFFSKLPFHSIRGEPFNLVGEGLVELKYLIFPEP